jgi:hypothetical protein
MPGFLCAVLCGKVFQHGGKGMEHKKGGVNDLGNCGNNFDHFECIKAELTADMTAISFKKYSHHRTL